MTKRDWEKQNRIEHVQKRMNQFFDQGVLEPNEHEVLLRQCGFPPSIEASEAIKSTYKQWKTELRKMRQILRHNSEKCDPNIDNRAGFLEKELKALYIHLLILRLLPIYPEKLN